MSGTRSHGGFFTLAIIFIIALYFSALALPARPLESGSTLFLARFFDTAAIFSTTPVQAVAAAAVLVCTCLLLLKFANSFSNGLNHFIPVIYLILVLSNPASAYLTPFHISAIMLVPALHFYFQYIVVEHDMSHLFISGFLMDLAICCCPPLFWLTPFMLVLGIGLTDEKFKYTVAFILSIAVPICLVSAVVYLVYGVDEALGVLPEFVSGVTPVFISGKHISLVSVGKMVVLTIFVITGVVTVLRNLGSYKITKYRIYVRLILLLLILTATGIIFASDSRDPWLILSSIPVSLICNETFNEDSRNAGKRLGTLMAVVLLVITVERVSLFIK